MNVYQKLNAAREDFHKLKLAKTGYNKFAGYYYFAMSDFLIPAMRVFKDHGLAGVVSFGSQTAEMRIVNLDDPTDFFVISSPMSTASLKGCHEVQNLGAVQTYLRRYLWVAALEIVEHEALDSGKPIGTKDKAGVVKAVKLAALDGIGDDLPPEAQEALKDLAAEVIELVAQGQPENALATIRAFGAEGDERIYLDRQLPSHVRTALRKVSQQQKAA